jgi:diguanylate cyclase (GGDEF)-like protein
VCEQIGRRAADAVKVLAVDDDRAISAALVALLAPSGIAVRTLNEPLHFWEALEEAQPDLLILDLDMPDLDGIDLCQAVRADARFRQLPVVFLTAHTDAACVQRIFEAGADDYVLKPIVGPELVTRVRNRLDRIRLYRELAERDGLTGVASRRKATATLLSFASMSGRFAQPTALALIDLDHFKRLNDQLGHKAGDDALRRAGQMLLSAFRGEDVVGRWGGEEFIVGMYGMTRDDAVKRMTDVLDSFRDEIFTGRGQRTMRLSFSGGVAEYPRDGTDLHDLLRAADEAMYRAKAAGRDLVLPADPAERSAL